jgi:hypothetical protein
MGRSRTRRHRPLPVGPYDLLWQPELRGGVGVPTHWERGDDLELFLRPDGVTVTHHGRDLTDEDIADALRLFGLTPADMCVTFDRSRAQREMKCLGGKPLQPFITCLVKAASGIESNIPVDPVAISQLPRRV